MDPKTKNKALSPVLEGIPDSALRDALRDIFRHYGYDLAALTVAAKAEIGLRLSEIARRQERGLAPWGRAYISNLLSGKVEISGEMKSAILALSATIDGLPLPLAQGRPVTILALSEVRPGSVVDIPSRKCAVVECPVWFIPGSGSARYCPAHRRRSSRKR